MPAQIDLKRPVHLLRLQSDQPVPSYFGHVRIVQNKPVSNIIAFKHQNDCIHVKSALKHYTVSHFEKSVIVMQKNPSPKQQQNTVQNATPKVHLALDPRPVMLQYLHVDEEILENLLLYVALFHSRIALVNNVQYSNSKTNIYLRMQNLPLVTPNRNLQNEILEQMLSNSSI